MPLTGARLKPEKGSITYPGFQCVLAVKVTEYVSGDDKVCHITVA